MAWMCEGNFNKTGAQCGYSFGKQGCACHSSLPTPSLTTIRESTFLGQEGEVRFCLMKPTAELAFLPARPLQISWLLWSTERWQTLSSLERHKVPLQPAHFGFLSGSLTWLCPLMLPLHTVINWPKKLSGFSKQIPSPFAFSGAACEQSRADTSLLLRNVLNQASACFCPRTSGLFHSNL